MTSGPSGIEAAASWTARTLPAVLWSQTAIIAMPFSDASRTMAGGVISREAQGERTV